MQVHRPTKCYSLLLITSTACSALHVDDSLRPYHTAHVVASSQIICLHQSGWCPFGRESWVDMSYEVVSAKRSGSFHLRWLTCNVNIFSLYILIKILLVRVSEHLDNLQLSLMVCIWDSWVYDVSVTINLLLSSQTVGSNGVKFCHHWNIFCDVTNTAREKSKINSVSYIVD